MPRMEPSLCRIHTPARFSHLAIRPTFNPNDFRHATTSLLKNHAVSDVYEPGSTFKLVTYSAALEQKVTSPDADDRLPGWQDRARGKNHSRQSRRTLRGDSSSQGSRGIERRGCREAGVADGPRQVHPVHSRLRLWRAHRRGVACGNPRTASPRSQMGSVFSIGSIAMGQEMRVTPVQLVSMVSTIANGGVYLPPHVLMQTSGPDGGQAQTAVRRHSSRTKTCPTRSRRARTASSPP